MRYACQADIALLQSRDIFTADPDLFVKPLTPEGIKAAVSALFWKGDFIQCLNLPGDTVQSVLKRSNELKNNEDAGLVTELTNGWWLFEAGIEPAVLPRNFLIGPDKQWIVNGDFVDPKKLYSIAVTDYLANGDTGYPTLQNAEPKPVTPLSQLKIRDLTTEIAATLGYGTSAAQPAREQLDTMQRATIPEPATETTFLHWVQSWSNADIFSSPVTSFDTHQQKRSIFSLKLYKLDFAYSIFQHNGTEQSIAQRFPGVTGVDLSNTDNFTYSADYQVRIERSAPRLGTYFESDLNFSRNNKRASAKPDSGPCFPGNPNTCYQASQVANYWYQEGGLGIRLTPLHQNPTGLKIILPLGMKTQVVRPYTQIASVHPAPPGASTATGPALVSAPRNYYLAFRPGLRYEHSFPRTSEFDLTPAKGKTSAPTPGKTFNSYVEAGFQTGRVFHSLSAFHFLGLAGTSGSPLCPATDGFVDVSVLDACLVQTNVINSGTPLDKVVAARNFTQQGLYLNFRLDMPLPGKSNFELLIENRGDYFFKRSSDVSLDTRFLDDFSTALLFPIWGKLSVSPGAELIFFKTKGNIIGNYYFSYSTSFAVNYSFDWRRGLKWPKASGYGNTDSAPQPLPSR